MTPTRPGTLLRWESFKGAEALQGPLNDLLQKLQDRLTLLEGRKELVILGPRRVTLPIDPSSPESFVDFQLPEDFTPSAVFPLALSFADVGAADTPVQPWAINYQIDGDRVRLVRVTTTTTTGVALDLSLGAYRG